MKNRYILALLVAIACGVVYIAAGGTRAVSQQSSAVATPTATARASIVGGQQVGDVLVDNQVVFRIRTSAGGYTPAERAQTVAARLNETLATGQVRPQDIRVARVNGQEVVMVRGQEIITADRPHARINGTSSTVLAGIWADNLDNAISGRPVVARGTGGTTRTATTGAATAETPVGQKIVPILSVGSGLRIGGAVVTGPRDRLDEVRAVAQVDANFSSAVRVRLLVPVSTENVISNISRVPETSVIGLADIKL